MRGKIDIHEHLTTETTEYSTGGGTYASGVTKHAQMMKIGGVKDMLPHLKELGIDKAVILSMGETGLSSNEKVREAAGMYPDVYSWMCNLSDDDPATVKERLSRLKEQGACGIGEFMYNSRIDSDFVQAVFQAAEELGMPVLFHMSPEEGFNYGIADDPGLPLLEEALKKYPNLIIIGHSQPFWHEISGDAKPDLASRNSWGEGPVIEGGRLIELFEQYPNLYGDLSANSGGNAVMRDESFGLRFLERFQDRLMFGTDMSSPDMEFPLGKWLDQKLAESALSEEAYSKICWKNAMRVLGIK